MTVIEMPRHVPESLPDRLRARIAAMRESRLRAEAELDKLLVEGKRWEDAECKELNDHILYAAWYELKTMEELSSLEPTPRRAS